MLMYFLKDVYYLMYCCMFFIHVMFLCDCISFLHGGVRGHDYYVLLFKCNYKFPTKDAIASC